MDNKILELGEGVSPIFIGFYQQRHVAGLPRRGVLGADHHLRRCQRRRDHRGRPRSPSRDTAVFRGSAMPTREASLNSRLSLFGRPGADRHPVRLPRRAPRWTTPSSSSAASRSELPRADYDRTAPLEEQARAQAPFLRAAARVAFLEPGWFIKLRELSFTFFAPDRWARALPRQPAEPHARRAKPVDHHRLQRGGPRGERLRPGQLRFLGFRVAGPGALLDRAPQHRLLRGGRTMRIRLCCLRAPAARRAPLGRLRPAGHRTAQHHRPRRRSTPPTGAAALRGRRHCRLRLRQGRRRHPGRRRLDPGSAGLLADEFMHSTTPPSQQEIDQRTPSVETTRAFPTSTSNLHKARAGAENAAEALQRVRAGAG